MEVSRDQNQQKYASILPAVDFARLENVLVVIGEAGFVQEDLPVEPADTAPTGTPGTTDGAANASPSVGGEKSDAN
jgi:hypothetical protein